MASERNCEREPNAREKPCSEDDQEKWIKVSKRKPHPSPSSFQPLASKTIFISHLPSDTIPSDIKNLFRKFGTIENIVIPPLKKSNLKFRFAFIKYVNSYSIKTAIQAMNGIKLEGLRLKVQLAKADKPGRNYPPSLTSRNPLAKIPITPKPHPKSSLRDHRSYREVSLPKNDKHPSNHHHSQPDQPHPHADQPPSPLNNPISKIMEIQEIDPQPDFFGKNPSKARIASTRILGEATESARNNIVAEEIDGEFSLVIKGERNLDNQELFDKSLIGVAHSSLSSKEIWNCIVAEGVISLSIKPLGGLLHLITFDSIEEKSAMFQSQWLEK